LSLHAAANMVDATAASTRWRASEIFFTGISGLRG
jgi:hypothetical protein